MGSTPVYTCLTTTKGVFYAKKKLQFWSFSERQKRYWAEHPSWGLFNTVFN